MDTQSHQPGPPVAIPIGDAGLEVGDGGFLLVAGPCAVESREQLLRIAEGVCHAGATALRGGAFKPRTSPYSFQGLGRDALVMLAEARVRTGLPIVTEVVDVRDADAVAAVADVLQVGARNMNNAPLLRELVGLGLPVLLKRGFGATIDDLMHAVDHLIDGGTDQIILCERGIRTFETSTRYTLDVAAVPVLRARTHLPVIVDPSHAAGDARYVAALARAAVAAGADGLLVEVHDDPASALSDGAQSLSIGEFSALVDDVSAIAAALTPRVGVPR